MSVCGLRSLHVFFGAIHISPENRSSSLSPDPDLESKCQSLQCEDCRASVAGGDQAECFCALGYELYDTNKCRGTMATIFIQKSDSLEWQLYPPFARSSLILWNMLHDGACWDVVWCYCVILLLLFSSKAFYYTRYHFLNPPFTCAFF